MNVARRVNLKELLINGYTKQMENTYKLEIPNDVISLFILYYDGFSVWDRRLHSKNIAIKNNDECVEAISTEHEWGSAYLTGVYQSGEHHWRFKILNGPWPHKYFLFGIWKKK
eukprot:836637_1